MKNAATPSSKTIIDQAAAGVVCIERRTGRDRRAGVDRRNCSIPVDRDRRSAAERRSGYDRRAKGLESLEARQLFSAVTFEAGILTVRGDADSPNDIIVNLTGNRVVAHVGDQSLSAKATNVRSIRVIGGEKADNVFIDDPITAPVNAQTGAGNDIIHTAGGNDLVIAGNGKDWVETGGGSDSIRAGNGRDTVIAGAGNDVVWAGNGSDSVLGGRGNDKITGESGDDDLLGGAGKDRIDAGAGRDMIRGEGGNDAIVAKSTDDVAGNGGTDSISLQDESAVPRSYTFSLINADTNAPIKGFENLSSGATLDLAKLPTRNLNIRANLPKEFAGSVRFKLNNQAARIESSSPYSVAGDTGGAFNAWTPTTGKHTLTAVAYSLRGSTGSAGTPINIKFNVVDTSDTGQGGTGGTGGSGNGAGTGAGTGENPNPGTGNTGGTGNTQNPGGSVSGNENVNPNAAAPTASIDAIAATVDAGHTIHVNAIASKINSGSRLSAKFEWDFGDAGSKFNKLVGFNAAHLYTQPGKYNVTLKVTDNAGKTDTTTLAVNVKQSSRQVYYVSNDGSDSNDGLSPASAVKSWDKVRSLVSDNTEFRFKAGQTFSVTDNITLHETNVLFGMFGNGDRPTLKWTSSSGPKYKKFFEVASNSRDITVRDFTFDSIFTSHLNKAGVPDAARPAGTNFSFVNNELLNVSYGVNSELNPTGVLVQENVAPLRAGMRAYLTYIEGTDHVIVGNTVANVTREHCIRSDGGQRVLIAYNDLTNIAEGKAGDKIDIMKQTITIHWGSDVYLYGNDTHGGRVEIGPLGEADGLKARNVGQKLSTVVIDSNHFDFGKYQRLEIDHGSSNIMVRGNRMTVPSGVGISIQATAKYTSWPQYGERSVSNVWVTSDNDISAASRVAVGRGSSNVNVAAVDLAAAA